MPAVVSSPLRCAVMAIMRAILKTPTRWRRLSENPILQNRYPIMVKCLNIGKNIGKSIYRSISNTNTVIIIFTVIVLVLNRPLFLSHTISHQNIYLFFWKKQKTETCWSMCLPCRAWLSEKTDGRMVFTHSCGGHRSLSLSFHLLHPLHPSLEWN